MARRRRRSRRTRRNPAVGVNVGNYVRSLIPKTAIGFAIAGGVGWLVYKKFIAKPAAPATTAALPEATGEYVSGGTLGATRLGSLG